MNFEKSHDNKAHDDGQVDNRSCDFSIRCSHILGRECPAAVLPDKLDRVLLRLDRVLLRCAYRPSGTCFYHHATHVRCLFRRPASHCRAFHAPGPSLPLSHDRTAMLPVAGSSLGMVWTVLYHDDKCTFPKMLFCAWRAVLDCFVPVGPQ